MDFGGVAEPFMVHEYFTELLNVPPNFLIRFHEAAMVVVRVVILYK